MQTQNQNEIMTFRTKLLLIMRLTTLCIFCFCLQISARVSSQTVTLKVSHGKLESVLNEFTRQTSYFFIYNDKSMKLSVPVTIDLKETAITEALYQLFRNQPLSYVIKGKNEVIEKKLEKANPGIVSQEVSPEIPNPPPVTVHGRVTNENGEPVAGATIAIKGGQAIGTTDGRGEYTVTVPDGNVTLVFSAITIETVEMKVNGRTELNVRVKLRVSQLQEVVVNKGYYSTTQKYNTGDVTRIDGKDIQKQPVTDPLIALQARVPGLYIQQNSGLPGSYSKIFLRGYNSIPFGKVATANDPLFIIDEVPYSSQSLNNRAINNALGYPGRNSSGSPSDVGQGQGLSPFNSLNPAEIESIEVLKDADATSLYGSRGANGVILITTKKGKAGQTKVDADISTGFGKIATKYDLLNTQQYLEMRREALKNDGRVANPNSDFDLTYWDTTRYTDWQKLLIGNTANYTNAQLSVSGGNANTTFLVSGGYSNQGTVFPGDYADKKVSVRFAGTHRSVNQRLQIQLTGGYVNDNNDLPLADFTGSILFAPDAPAPFDSNGNLNWALKGGSVTFRNPFAGTFSHAKATVDNLLGSLIISYKIIDGLNVQASLGYSHSQMNQLRTSPSWFYAPPDNTNPINRILQKATSDNYGWIIEPQLNYHKQIGKLVVDGLIGSTFQENKTSSFELSASGFSSDALITNPILATTKTIDNYSATQYKYNSIQGRIGLKWDDKYLLNLTGRRDGSSRFGPGKQFGNFGAIGAGWIFSSEKFISDALPFLNFGKLRASYGVAGNDQIGDYQYLSTYTPQSATYQNGPGLSPTLLTNPYFQWELTRKLEGGIELGFVQNRVNIEVNYYRNRTGNQLVGYPLPRVTGFTSIQYNLPALMQNTGWEFLISSDILQKADLKWTSSLNLSLPRNKLMSFPGIESSSYNQVYKVGSSIFTRYLYHYEAVDPQRGIYTFESKNATGTPSSSIERYFTKPVTQTLFGGFENSFQYKGFQLDVMIQFVKQTGLNYLNFLPDHPGFYNINMPVEVLNRWQKSGDATSFQQFTSSFSTAYLTFLSYFKNSDAILVNTSFIRLKTLALSYRFPDIWIRKIGAKNCSVYANAQNLFTISPYQVGDPESRGFGLPPLRMITFGVHIGL